MKNNNIIVKGARVHNLKDIYLELPRNKLIVFTGLSGSGKSSLAFDTIYAEGQRRYVESLSAYARQFLGQLDKPDVDYIEGLSPAISIDQKSTSRNPRSTVGTVTEIYDYLRLLYAHLGEPHCPKCGTLVAKQTAQQIVDQILSYPKDSRVYLLAPIVRGRKGEYQSLLEKISKDGFTRVRVDGCIYDLSEEIKMDKNKKHNIEILVDRLKVNPEIRKRLFDSVEISLKYGQGMVLVQFEVIEVTGTSSDSRGSASHQEVAFSEKFSCPKCNYSLEEIAPRLFSFNSPYGACPDCKGLGNHLEFDPELVISDRNLPLRYATQKILNLDDTWFGNIVEGVGEKYDFTLDTPVKDLIKKQLDVILYGSGGKKVNYTYDFKSTATSGRLNFYKEYEGIIGNLKRRYYQTHSEHMRFHFRRYMSAFTCHTCEGKRLNKEALAVTFRGYTIWDLCELSIDKLLTFFIGLKLEGKEEIIAQQILKEIKARLSFLNNVGLDYLTLNRSAATLSGGESQRIRLATQIGSGLVGVLYILDEPSIGLHQRDNKRLIEMLFRLRDLGNTLIVVEHDEEMIRSADYIVDIGPGPGKHGGEIVISGSVDKVKKSRKSITGKYLKKEKKILLPEKRRYNPRYKDYRKIIVRGAKENNLKNINVEFPLGNFICVTGVSGSGKSTLVDEILYKGVAKRFYKSITQAGECKAIDGLEHIDKIIIIDQSPIGRTPRSNPATYTDLFTPIRNLYALLPEAKVRGYKPGRFSFNVKGGRCESCQGDGLKKIAMHFLPDVYVTCDVCKGKRYNRETLEIRYKGLNISEVLKMTANEAFQVFKNIPQIRNKLKTIIDVGLGYICLGQSATTLSGGEAQRVKLAAELSKRSTGKTLYLLDEPTTGLHFADIQYLLNVLNKLVDQGNTVIVIEHNLEVIKMSDYIIDLGPEGGDEGGEIVALGSPEDIIRNRKSYTGQFLKRVLDTTKAER